MVLSLIMLYPQNAEMLVEPGALAASGHTGGKRDFPSLVGAGDEWSRTDY
jgi:hypothetical protein